jgi:fumarate reductase subunit D
MELSMRQAMRPRRPRRRSREPFFWALFSSGGMLAALVLPAVGIWLWVARPLGWVEAPADAVLIARLAPALLRLFLFLLIALGLFHWEHRFRYTLYDGLQLSHLYGLIATVCYGGATVLSVFAAWALWRFP